MLNVGRRCVLKLGNGSAVPDAEAAPAPRYTIPVPVRGDLGIGTDAEVVAEVDVEEVLAGEGDGNLDFPIVDEGAGRDDFLPPIPPTGAVAIVDTRPLFC